MKNIRNNQNSEPLNIASIKTESDNTSAQKFKAQQKFGEAYNPWTKELDEQLTILCCEEKIVKDLMEHFGRSKGGIIARIEKLELETKYPK